MTAPCTARVLVVENDFRARGQLIEILTRPGFTVRAAEGNGPALQENAKELASSFRPHVVVMDLRLVDDEYSADRSGLELLKEKGFSSSRCVLHSAYLSDDYRVTREALVEARVADVVGKEEPPIRLIGAVEKAAREGCICCKEFSIDWPAAWDEKAVIKTLFDGDAELPSGIVTDILGHLFPDAKLVMLKTLKRATQSSTSIFRGRAVLFQAWTDDKEPFVVKLSPQDRTVKEVNAYKENIKDRLVGRFYAELQDHKIFWELGGICYSFIGSPQKAIETFAVFYQQEKTPEEIIRPLQHFFGEVWGRHYSDSQKPLDNTLFAAYDSFLKLSQRLGEPHTHAETIHISGLPGEYLNPLRWIIEHADDSFISTANQAITHGDLHGDNLFVEEGHAWAIDFERSKHGPILRDFVELEQDIVTRLVMLPTSDMLLFRDFATILCTPSSPTDSFIWLKRDQDEEIKRSLDVISAIRSMAYTITGYKDMREYYWSLLCDTIFGIISTDNQSTKWMRGLLYASVLCDRLSHWDDKRPQAG